MEDPARPNGATALQSITHIPIAQLTPLLSAPSSRSIKAVVTLTWPYSSITGSLAFLLAEPDFRLRRTRGQVRVQFSGSSAKIVAKSGIASGDEVILSLDGAEWVDEATVSTPGRGVEFELRFTERLLVQFKQDGNEDIEIIDIDHPAPEPEVAEISQIPTPEPEPAVPLPIVGSKARQSNSEIDGDLWSSPAFIKRARTSLGSLYDSDYDPFATEDGTVPGKGRKRTRLSSSWRYVSRSPSPEQEEEEMEISTEQTDVVSKTAVTMADESCQTVDTEADAAGMLADFARQSTNVMSTVYGGVDNNPEAANLVHPWPSPSVGLQGPAVNIEPPLILESQSLDRDVQLSVHISSTPEPPRLQPVPSDSLPLVSPLLTRKIEQFQPKSSSHESEHVEATLKSTIPFSHDGQPIQTTIEEEDLYGASPRGQYGESRADFHEPNKSFNDAFHAEYPAVDQHDRWEDSGKENHHEPFLSVEDIRSRDVPMEDLQPPIQEYPELEENEPHQSFISSWDKAAAPTKYPVSVNFGNETERQSPMQYRQITATSKSRSQSVQSQVVDLTESDDEDNEDPNGESSEGDEEEQSDQEIEAGHFQEFQSVNGDHIDDDDHEVEEDYVVEKSDDRDGQQAVQGLPFEEFEEEDEEGSDQDLDDAHQTDNEFGYRTGLHAIDAESNLTSNDEAEEYEELQDGEDEEPSYLQPHHHLEGGDFEEVEEESYDEDEIEDEIDDEMNGHQEVPKLLAGKEPEVIDLLSSDDEDQPITKQALVVSRTRSSSYEAQEEVEPQDGHHSSDEEMEGASMDEREDTWRQHSIWARSSNKKPFYHDESVVSESESIDHQALSSGFKEPDEADWEEDDEEAEDENEEMEEMKDEEMEDNLGAHETGIPTTTAHDILNDEAEAEAEITGKLDVEIPDNKFQSDFQPVGLQDLKTTGSSKPHQTPLEISNARPDKSLRHSIGDESSKPTISSLAKPTLFSRMFNLDGANDEPNFLYPPMPADTSPSPSQSAEVEQVQPPENINKQLPTPEDTQQSAKIISPETSFTSVASISVITDDHNDLIDVEGNLEETLNISNADLTKTDGNLDTAGDLLSETVETIIAEEFEESVTLIHSPDKNQLDKIDFASEANGESLPQLALAEEAPLVVSDVQSVETSEPSIVIDNEPTVTGPILDTAQDSEIPATPSGSLRSKKSAAITSTPDAMHDSDDESTSVSEQIQSEMRSSIVQLALSKNLEVKTAMEEQKVQHPDEIKDADIHVQTPRRSPRTQKSSAKVFSQNKQSSPSTPRKSKSPRSASTRSQEKERWSPMALLDSRATPKGHDASIELALSSLDSPSKPPYDLRTPPVADLKLRLCRTLRNEFKDFSPLKAIRYHLNKKLDILGIVTTSPPEPQRAKNGPRHYNISFNITDPSIAPAGVTLVQVFRPYKEALPLVKPGDGILLRNFQVHSLPNKGFALRSAQEESSWAVFKDEEVQVRGPPVEFGVSEKNYVQSLQAWFGTLDSTAIGKIERANGEKSKLLKE